VAEGPNSIGKMSTMRGKRQTQGTPKDVPCDPCAKVRDLFDYLAPGIVTDGGVPQWPPDAFALAAGLLQKTGAYIHVVDKWPPLRYRKTPDSWKDEIARIGREWRLACTKQETPPQEVRAWWNIVLARSGLEFEKVFQDHELCDALIAVCAAADQASAGAGVPDIPREDAFLTEARITLIPDNEEGSTLCKRVHRSRLRVLPNLHTPQSGMTIRSLSQHLALCQTGGVKVFWNEAPTNIQAPSLNLLVIPFPDLVIPSQFRGIAGNLMNIPRAFDFFTHVRSEDPAGIRKKIKEIFDRAMNLIGSVDMVVLPELGLSEKEKDAVAAEVGGRGAILLAGVGATSLGPTKPGKNYVTVEMPVSPSSVISLQQHKHHRWKLDRSQIMQYGLGGNLDPRSSWWEHIQIQTRKLRFLSIRPWLTLCALICEDLARQDPVSELVRAVGPNLVIALLMDGPQLAPRWPARYATVLADDPGSSVLTLTSVGMAELCRPFDKQTPCRTVALWKDARGGGSVQIELPKGKDALVLNLSVEFVEEWTADGRSDGGSAGFPVLSGIHSV
jgi:hypothetical protein